MGQGQPINTGIYIDQTYDIGRVEDVHWNPWYSQSPAFVAWQLLNGAPPLQQLLNELVYA